MAKRLAGRAPATTDARTCECGKTVFAYTSLLWIAIVDAEDGHWLRDYKWSAAGHDTLDRASYARSNRYGRETGKSRRLHQVVTGHVYAQLDHLNGNGHDCRKANLRPCTSAERNRKRRYTGLSGFKGVTQKGNRCEAYIWIDRQRKYLGTFGFRSDAAVAYNVHAAYLHGEFAKLTEIKIEEYMHD